MVHLTGTLWVDDIRQAALLALWRTSSTRDRGVYGHARRVARSAAIDELRRVTAARRDPRDWMPAPDLHHDTPEGMLQAAQTLRALPAQRLAEALA